MADIRGVPGTKAGSYLNGSLLETAVMPSGTNPTVTITSANINSANDLLLAFFTGDPGAAATLGIGAITLSKDGAAGSSKITKGTVVVKCYGTLAAATNIALMISTTQNNNRAVYQTKIRQS
jgi:hypothetical protein